MKLLALAAIFLAWLAVDRLVTLPASVHSPAPTPEQWATFKAEHAHL